MTTTTFATPSAIQAVGARWTPGERFHHVIEASARRLAAAGDEGHLAVDADDGARTYLDLIADAHDLARRIAELGGHAGCRIGVLIDRPSQTYPAMLAISMLAATAVPMDPALPAERVAYITDDADVSLVVTLEHLAAQIPPGVGTLVLDQSTTGRAHSAGRRVDNTFVIPVDDPDPLAYIVYTSGSAGRPKGVMVAQSSVCNFLRVAVECYRFVETDRVYQGLTIAFDFSVEEIWVPLACGATLVPRPAGPPLLNRDLRDFLVANRVTALCCVPTQLASIGEALPALRLLLVSGEACPAQLARRWLGTGVRMLNVYGPTEATVSATWSILSPDEPVTIGRALPTYTVVVVDPASGKPVPHGAAGEIVIAGPGVAAGYLNRPELTAASFVELTLEGDDPVRVYRTGDRGRVDRNGAIEYLGRADGQVKLRGYRIELSEIESALLAVPLVTAAAVDTVVRGGQVVDLAAYVCCPPQVTDSAIFTALRRQLPGYMVPAYLQRVAAMPMTAAGKLDRAALPPPGRRSRRSPELDHVEARSDGERVVADLLAQVLRVETVSVNADFFDDLGADSLLMAAFCALLRELPGRPEVGIRDAYAHRTVIDLTTHLETLPTAVDRQAEPATGAPRPTGTIRYGMCGLVQALFLLGGPAALLAGGAAYYDWAITATGGAALLRVVFGALALAIAACLGPVALKWLLVGRVQPGRVVPLWSFDYLRMWAARSIIRYSPLVLLTGSWLHLAYLRLLGARIGPGVVLLARGVPGCPDLIEVGSGSVISKDVYLSGYRLERDGLHTGTVRIGERCYVGAGAMLDIHTTIGDRAQLGHASSLHEGQVIPAGQQWHGCPARAASDVLLELEDDGAPVPCRRLTPVAQVLACLAVAVAFAGADVAGVRWLDPPSNTWGRYLVVEALLAAVAYPALLGLRFAVAVGLPRAVAGRLTADRVYPRRGLPWLLARTVAVAGNAKSLNGLFGDSSYVVPYTRLIGYDIDGTDQTGSALGLDFRHDAAHLVSFGARSMASDGLSVANLEVTATSFRLRRSSVGADCYLGNAVHIPPGGDIQDDCLLGTKVMVPVGRPLPRGTGLLGSPPFEIPRTVARDAVFDHLKAPAVRIPLLRSKNRHNLATMALSLASHAGGILLALTVLAAVTGLSARPDPLSTALGAVAAVLVEIGYLVLVERAAGRWRRLRPAFHSIYDVRFWRHERMWKLSVGAALSMFDGTALKPLIWRMLGVRVGRRLLDDGCAMPEKTLVTIGDDCVLGAQSTIQCHSLEDATFKSDRSGLGDRCVVGPRALVHYDVQVGDGARVGCDAFVMKGERVRAGATWTGNPAAVQVTTR